MKLLDSGNKKEPKVNSSRNRPGGDQENLAGMAQRNFPVTSPSYFDPSSSHPQNLLSSSLSTFLFTGV